MTETPKYEADMLDIGILLAVSIGLGVGLIVILHLFTPVDPPRGAVLLIGGGILFAAMKLMAQPWYRRWRKR